MPEFEVVCVDKQGPEPRPGFAHIVRLGIKNEDSTISIQTEEQVVNRVQNGEKFFVNKDGHKAYLMVDETAGWRLFVKTRPDSTIHNNLEFLEPCPKDDLPNYNENQPTQSSSDETVGQDHGWWEGSSDDCDDDQEYENPPGGPQDDPGPGEKDPSHWWEGDC